MAKVRGIGVAVITKICGGHSFFFHKAARWATPNLCCSSITTKPKFLNTTVGSIRACVPINISILPCSNSSKIRFLSLALVVPVSISTRRFNALV